MKGGIVAEKLEQVIEPEPSGAGVSQQTPIPVDNPPATASGWTKFTDFARAYGPALVSKWPMALGFIAFGVVLFFLIRPFDNPRELPGDNAAIAWNATIERLGIQPLYPPQEDFFVGDVYVTLDDPQSAVAGQTVQYPSNVYKGRGVKIGHIDMRESIKKGGVAFKFADTKLEDGNAAVEQSRSEVALPDTPDNQVNLSLAAFPGISIKHRIDADTGFWWFFAGRRSGETEEISIPYAESYGAPVVDSIFALGKYCSDKATSGFCTDPIARKILGYSLGRDVGAVNDGKYIFPISISLVGQVFLARELRISRYRGDSLTANMRSSEPDVSQPPVASGGEEETKMEGKKAVNSAEYENMQSTRVSLKQVFARPVAFGFRRVSFALPRSTPTAPTGG
ncbi:hypothetical protein [Mesorhizobium sp. B2-1-5]|uniref:hypothetical protein n=1 Tax=Mesorhizobium sp. B2-1-5 TaxID=2589969 RepID=UPI00116E5243|nr:hypothetical protein [Mesorhizobium sp. B2-1-5]TPM94224.1 hypothetical protein FJ966_18325 [Mesorhizobium sp. B2-1-5]